MKSSEAEDSMTIELISGNEKKAMVVRATSQQSLNCCILMW